MVTFLANTFTFTMSPPVRLSSVCRLSVTFMHFTQAIEIFGKVLRHLVGYVGHLLTSKYNFTEELNTSDFGPIERYISETVQDRS